MKPLIISRPRNYYIPILCPLGIGILLLAINVSGACNLSDTEDTSHEFTIQQWIAYHDQVIYANTIVLSSSYYHDRSSFIWWSDWSSGIDNVYWGDGRSILCSTAVDCYEMSDKIWIFEPKSRAFLTYDLGVLPQRSINKLIMNWSAVESTRDETVCTPYNIDECFGISDFISLSNHLQYASLPVPNYFRSSAPNYFRSSTLTYFRSFPPEFDEDINIYLCVDFYSNISFCRVAKFITLDSVSEDWIYKSLTIKLVEHFVPQLDVVDIQQFVVEKSSHIPKEEMPCSRESGSQIFFNLHAKSPAIYPRRCALVSICARFVHSEVMKWIKIIYTNCIQVLQVLKLLQLQGVQLLIHSFFGILMLSLKFLPLYFWVPVWLQFFLPLIYWLQMQFLKIWQSTDHSRCILNICARFTHHDKCWGFTSAGEWQRTHMNDLNTCVGSVFCVS